MQLTNKKKIFWKKFLHKKLNANILINFIDFFFFLCENHSSFLRAILKKWIEGLN